MKKKIILLLVICTIFLVGCKSEKQNSTDLKKEQEELIAIVLKINMPLNFDDLDDLFEFPMTESLQKGKIGTIVGDGSPVNEYGPYATDIEFDIQLGKIDEFKKMIQNYRFPKGSYLEVDNQKDEEYGEFGDLLGIRVTFNHLSKNQIQKIYKDLSNELSEDYIYKTIYQLQDITTVYYYGEDVNHIKNKINKYIESNNYIDDVTMMEMSTGIHKQLD